LGEGARVPGQLVGGGQQAVELGVLA
jgi:hypothetical protein